MDEVSSAAMAGSGCKAACTSTSRGDVRGTVASSLPGEDLENLLPEPLEAVRAKLGIALPTRYRHIMEALASGRIAPVPAHQ